MRIDLLDPADTFNGFVLIDVTTQAVNSICWINNYPAIFQAFCQLFYEAGLWIVGMNVYQHEE